MKILSVSLQAKGIVGGQRYHNSLATIFARWVQKAHPESTKFDLLYEVDTAKESGIVCRHLDAQYFVTKDGDSMQYMISINKPVLACIPCDSEGCLPADSTWLNQ